MKKYKKWLFGTVLSAICLLTLGKTNDDVVLEATSTGGNAEQSFVFESNVRDSDITDGSAPFDDNNQPGNDNGKRNGIVRTFDTVTYPIKVTINPKNVDKLENIKLKITGTLDNGITDGRVNGRFAVGGTEDVNTGEVKFEQTYTIDQTGNSVMIPVSVDVQGAKSGTVLKPNIQVQVVSVDGKDISDDNVVNVFNDLPSVTTSGKVSLRSYVGTYLTGQGMPYVPYSAFDGNTESLSNVNGFSVAFGLAKLPGRSDYRGATSPSGKINYSLDLSGRVYWDGGPNAGTEQPLDFSKNDKPIQLLSEHPIGDSDVTAPANTLLSGKSFSDPYPSAYNTARSNMTDLSADTISKQHENYVWNSGEWGVNAPAIGTNKVSYTGSNSDYAIGSTFPEYRADSWRGSKLYGNNDKVFSTNGFLFEMPNEYRIGGKNNPEGYANNVYYDVDVRIDSYENDDGVVEDVNDSTRSVSVIERNTPTGSYSVNNTFEAYPSGRELGSYHVGDSAVSHGDPSVVVGEDVQYTGYTMSSMLSYGGHDVVYRWNTDSFNMPSNYATIAEDRILDNGYRNRNSKHEKNNTDKQKVYYGVQTFDDNSFESFTAKGKDDYDWYATYDEAVEHGEVGALRNSVTDVVGVGTSGTSFPLEVDTTKVGSHTEQDTPNMIVTNMYAYPEADRKEEVDVSKNASYNTPTLYDENGVLTKMQAPVGRAVNFETLGVLNAEVSSTITSDKATYYNSDDVKWTVDSDILYPQTGVPDSHDGSVRVQQTLPAGLDYQAGSGRQGDVQKEPDIVQNEDGTTTLTWDLLVSQKDNTIDSVSFVTSINPMALTSASQSSLKVENVISSPIDTRKENLRDSSHSINIVKVGMVGVHENIDVAEGDKNSAFTVRMNPYTTIEDEKDVVGLTHIPQNKDSLGSNFSGSAKLKSISVSGDKPVSIYLNNKRVTSDRPHEVDTSKDGWYKYTGGDQDISGAQSLIFKVDGILTSSDNVEIAMTIQTNGNTFGDEYVNDTTINSATNYKLSPVSNRVRYTIKSDVDLALERVQIYTDNAKDGLPVKVRVSKDVRNDRSLNEKVTLAIYDKASGEKVTSKEYAVKDLQTENELLIPADKLSPNTHHTYEVRIEGYNDNRLYVLDGQNALATDGHTATEGEVTVDLSDTPDTKALDYKGVVMTEREYGKDMVVYNETLNLPLTHLPEMVTGYGFGVNQAVGYSNDLTAEPLDVGFEAVMDADLVDGEAYPVVDGFVHVPLEISEGDSETVVNYTLPETFVSATDGSIVSQQMLLDNPTQAVVNGGRQLYVPVWLDELGTYDVVTQSETPVGVNEVTVKITRPLDVSAYMLAHGDSGTLNNDALLIEPSNSWLDQFNNEDPFEKRRAS